MEHSRSKKNNTKMITIIVITASIAIIIAGALFIYIPKMMKTNNIQEYKKSAYTSILCQYNCPLVNSIYQNKTQLLPDKTCTDACTAVFKAKNYSTESYSPNDLQSDNLLTDMSTVITQCQRNSLSKDENRTLDNVKYFTCVAESLKNLEEKYPYLKN